MAPLLLLMQDVSVRERNYFDVIYLTAIGLTPVGSSTAHIYTQTIHIMQRM
jgi:hypothetical protein